MVWESAPALVPLQSHLAKQLKLRAGFHLGSPSLCRVALLGGGGMARVAGSAPGRVPSSPLEAVLVAGSPSELLAGAAFPAHLEAIWSWAQAGAWLNGIEVEGCQ